MLQMRQYPALYGACRTASRFSASSRKGLDDSDVVLRQEDAGDTRVEQIGGGFGGGGISVAETGGADDKWGQQIAGDAIQDDWSD